MFEEKNPNIIRLSQVNEEEREMLLSKDKVYGDIDKPCPWCSSMALTEDTYGYEKVISCSHCDYSVSKTI